MQVLSVPASVVDPKNNNGLVHLSGPLDGLPVVADQVILQLAVLGHYVVSGFRCCDKVH